MSTPNFEHLLKESDKDQKKQEEKTPVSESVSALVKNLEKGKPEDALARLVPRNKILFHKNNDFEMKEIESLAKSILMFDVMSIPSGYYDEEEDKYVLESGERRTRALDLLIDTYKSCEDKESQEYALYQKNIAKYEKGYPFRVMLKRELDEEITEVDEINSRLRLIDANIEVRDYTEEERRKRILEKTELVKRKDALLGIPEKKSALIKEISESEGVSTRQAYKYAAADSLIPELRQLFVDNQITLNDGEFYSKLTDIEQQKIVELLKNGTQGNAKELYALQQELAKVQKENEEAIFQHEEEVRNLIQEKKAAEESLAVMQKVTQETIESNIKEIREKLEAEYKQLGEKSTEEQQEKVTSLEQELETLTTASKSLKLNYEEEHQQNEKKELEIQELKKKIESLQKPAQKNNGEDIISKVKNEMSYKLTYDMVGRNITEFKSLALTQPINKDDIIANIDTLITALMALKNNLNK